MTHPQDLKYPALKLRVYMEPQRVAESKRRLRILATYRDIDVSTLSNEDITDFLAKHLPNESYPS